MAACPIGCRTICGSAHTAGVRQEVSSHPLPRRHDVSSRCRTRQVKHGHVDTAQPRPRRPAQSPASHLLCRPGRVIVVDGKGQVDEEQDHEHKKLHKLRWGKSGGWVYQVGWESIGKCCVPGPRTAGCSLALGAGRAGFDGLDAPPACVSPARQAAPASRGRRGRSCPTSRR
jgi:hypothetical protein